MSKPIKTKQSQSMFRTISWSTVIVVGMFGFGFAMVPIYNVFCNITGLNGNTSNVKTQTEAEFVEDKSRTVKVQFLTNVSQDARWNFAAEKFEMDVHPGKIYTAQFVARNLRSQPVVGQAIPSVMPSVAALHFHKTECFCFTQQAFKAKERREMPVSFVIDPKLPEDVETVTLAYTFFDVTQTANISKTNTATESKPEFNSHLPLKEESSNGG